MITFIFIVILTVTCIYKQERKVNKQFHGVGLVREKK